MGVSGCGKTSVGQQLAQRLNLLFYDADDFHSIQNIEKMKNNIPLTDADRKPWLEALAINIENWAKSKDVVLACSALKESYRQALSTYCNTIDWVFLSGDFTTIENRMQQRENHFMKSSLLQSQFDALEIPSYGLHIDIKKKVEAIVDEIIQKLPSNA